MGIRFYCPNGHKLNVKEFQAGRRGICPFCGARTQIPTQSTRPSSKSSRDPASPTVAVDAGDPQDSDSSPDILPGEPPEISSAARGSKISNTTSSAGEAPPKAVASVPAAAVVRHDTSSRGNVPGPATGEPSPQAGSVCVSPPLPGMPSVSAEPPDPIAEAPEMIWYIRPPSGGQFGPAPGELMRTWMNEGRVSADSLVWREGWRDWQEAGAVFPKLRGNQLLDVLETASAAPTAASRATRPREHRSADRSQMALLVILGLAVAVLLVVFLYVLMKP